MFTVNQYVNVNQGGITFMGRVLKIYTEANKLLLLLNDNGQIVMDMKYCTPIRNYIPERD